MLKHCLTDILVAPYLAPLGFLASLSGSFVFSCFLKIVKLSGISRCGKRIRSLLSPVCLYSAWFCVVKATIAGAKAPQKTKDQQLCELKLLPIARLLLGWLCCGLRLQKAGAPALSTALQMLRSPSDSSDHRIQNDKHKKEKREAPQTNSKCQNYRESIRVSFLQQ